MKRVLAVLVLFVPAMAFANEPRFSVSASAGAGYVTDRSLDFVGDTDALTVGDLRVGWAPGWANRHIELDLGYNGTSESGTTFGTLQTSLSVKTLQLGVSYRRPLVGPLDAYGRLAGLYDFDTLDLSASQDALHASQTTHTLGASLSAGLEVTAVKFNQGNFGFQLELGYAQRFTNAHFDSVAPDVASAKPTPVAFTPVDVGSVNLSGIQWRLGAVLRF